MNNKVKFGLCDVHVAKITVANDGTISYGTPFAIPGAVSLTLDPAGESEPFYADNTQYFIGSSNQGYTGSIELALIPDDFRTQILGETVDSNNAHFENIDDIISPFALGFRINGDKTNRKYWYYNNTATRPSNTSQTIEATKTPVTETLNITSTARPDGQVRTFMDETTENATAYANFFNEVYERTA